MRLLEYTVCFVLLLLCLPFASSAAETVSLPSKQIIESPVARTPSFAKYALVIGVTDYESASRLSVCGKDALNFASLLKTKFGFDGVIVMTSEPGATAASRPTQRKIKKALEELYTGIVPGVSEVVVYFSGHGTRSKDHSGNDADWLVPEDGDPKDVPGSCINYTSIRERLVTLRPKRVLLVTDACRDLLGAKGVGPSGFGKSLSVSEIGNGMAELQSCQPTESSLEGDPRDFKESVFTHFLIQGMSGHPDAVSDDLKSVTFDSLQQYVKFSVHKYAAGLHSTQTPDGRSSSGAMVIALVDSSVVSQVALVDPLRKLPSMDIPALPSIRKNPIDTTDMIFIPAGEFVMGSDLLPDALQHKVHLTSYWIYKAPVTVSAYRKYCQVTGAAMPVAPSYGWHDEYPMTNVNVQQCEAYAAWAGGTLPTEAQWEKAARGTDARDYPWGATFDGSRCINSVDTRRSEPAAVGLRLKSSSPYGVVDMSGNVWQWCSDWYQADYYKSASPKNPIGPAKGTLRVCRGGSWKSDSTVAFQTAFRSSQLATANGQPDTGFRVVVVDDVARQTSQ
ncbi:MAG TPA: SUMF1/EgtB/PvdO family nonheme iron enzyme [Capsulimonadaceae bacterium]|jgi:iron(II)-dependent oxidoreductase